MSIPPLVAIGRISYGLYLFHIPVNALVHSTRASQWPGIAEVGTHLSLTFAAAAMSFVLVERRVLRLKERWKPGFRTRTVGIATVPDTAGS